MTNDVPRNWKACWGQPLTSSNLVSSASPNRARETTLPQVRAWFPHSARQNDSRAGRYRDRPASCKVSIRVSSALLSGLAGWDMQGEQLAALDELAGDGVVGLDVEQVPALAEEAGRDDPGRLLVLGQEACGSRREAVGVVLGDLGELAAGDVVQPHTTQVGLVADVLLHQDLTAGVGDVVEHLRPRCGSALGAGGRRAVGRADRAADQQGELAAPARVGGIGESQPPQPGLAGAQLGRQRTERRGGDEVEVVRVARMPGTVLRPLVRRHTLGVTILLERVDDAVGRDSTHAGVL